MTPGEPQITLSSERSFTYDYVFDTDCDQEDVYNTCVRKLVDGALEGYNATVLAYGQVSQNRNLKNAQIFGVSNDITKREDQNH